MGGLGGECIVLDWKGAGWKEGVEVHLMLLGRGALVHFFAWFASNMFSLAAEDVKMMKMMMMMMMMIETMKIEMKMIAINSPTMAAISFCCFPIHFEIYRRW